MKNLRFVTQVLAVAVITLASLCAWSETCQPAFETVANNRSLPHSYVDQGLDSLPHVYPKHVLLLQRRYSQIGGVEYSLLVYKKDAAVQSVTIEGVAVRHPKAWGFTANCSSDTAMDGLVTTLEGIAALGKEKE